MRPHHSVAALVFDFDGLILDTETAEYDSISHVFGQHGTEFSLDLWRTFIGTTDHAHWTDVLLDQVDHHVDVEAVRADRRRHNRALLAELDVLPGIVDLLDAARVERVPVAVASSSHRDWVVPHLDRIGLLDRFATICTRDDVARGKPAPDLYELAVSRLGVDAAGAVAIEDSINGCVAAHAAGLAVVAVPSPFLVGLDFAMADLVVGSAAELGLDVLSDLVGVALVIRLRSEAWQLAGAGIAALGVVAMFVAIRRVSDAGNVIDAFFAVLGFAIAIAGISLALSSVALAPGVLVVVNGWRRHRIPIDEVIGIGIAGIGDRRGAGPGEPPPRATWVVRIDTTSGSVLAAGLLANRKPQQREQLLAKAEMVARHCGVGRSPA